MRRRTIILANIKIHIRPILIRPPHPLLTTQRIPRLGTQIIHLHHNVTPPTREGFPILVRRSRQPVTFPARFPRAASRADAEEVFRDGRVEARV